MTIVTHTAAHNADQSGTTATSISSTSATYSAGSTLDVIVSYYRNGNPSPTVTLTSGVGGTLGGTSGSISASLANTTGTAFGVEMLHCYVYNITGGTGTVTAHFSIGVPFWSIQVVELKPTSASDTFDVAGTGSSGGSVVSSIASNSFTTTHNNGIVVAGLCANNGQTWTAGNINGAASTLIESYATTQVGSEYQTIATAGAMTAAGSIGGSTALAISCVAFWDGAGAASSPVAHALLIGQSLPRASTF